jgi:hypothetical protein
MNEPEDWIIVARSHDSRLSDLGGGRPLLENLLEQIDAQSAARFAHPNSVSDSSFARNRAPTPTS